MANEQKSKENVNEYKKKILKQKFGNKSEIAHLKAELKNTVKKINQKIAKAKIHEKQLKEKIRNEKIDFQNSEKINRKKTYEEFKKNDQIIKENKKLISKHKKLLRKEMIFLNQENRNKIIDSNRKFQIELKDLKKKLKIERKKQKSKIVKTKKMLLDKKNKLRKQLEEEKIRNNEALFLARNNIKEKEIELRKKQQDFIDKRIQNKLKHRSEKIMEINKALSEKEELRKSKIEEQNKIKEQIINLKIKNIDEIKQEEKEIEFLKTDLKEIKDEKNEKDIETREKIKEIEQEEKQELNKNIFELQNIQGSELTIDKIDSNYSEDNESRFRGSTIYEPKKRELNLYKKYDKKESKLKIDNLKLFKDKIKIIKEFQELKRKDSLVDIREFAKYISFVTGEEKGEKEVNSFIISCVANILKGKALSFDGGYFKMEIIKGCKWINFIKYSSNSRFNVVSTPENKYTNEFKKVVKDKLRNGIVIKISNNIALKEEEGQITVLHDLGFLR